MIPLLLLILVLTAVGFGLIGYVLGQRDRD